MMIRSVTSSAPSSIRSADAKQAAIDESVVTAGGVTVHNKTTTPVSSSSDKEHDVWQQWTTLEEGGTLVAAWLHDGATWVKRGIVEEYVPRIDVGEGTFGVLAGGRLEANSVTADALLIGGSRNLIPNGDLELGDATGWPDSAYYRESDPDRLTMGPPLTWSSLPRRRPCSSRHGRMGSRAQETLVFEISIKTKASDSGTVRRAVAV